MKVYLRNGKVHINYYYYYYYYYSVYLNSSSQPKTKSIPGERRKQVVFSMAIEKWELMHECLPKHSGREQQD